MAEVKTMPEPARQTVRRRRSSHNRIEPLDIALVIILGVLALLIVIPFINVLAISFVTQQEYLKTSILLFPKEFTLENYQAMFEDGRIWTGYRTTTILLLIGVPINLFLTTSMAYGLSRPDYPFKRFFIFFVVVTMMFNGGIIPMYLLMKQLHLINSLWSVVFAYGINAFYLIIMMNYFSNLPIALSESAKLDGAGEWTILLKVILPLSMPIMATMTLFYAVDRWNEWFNAMIFIRKGNLTVLQLALRSIVIDSQISQQLNVSNIQTDKQFTEGMKMAAVIASMLPIMCVFPLLQRHFVKGMLIGAIKA
ncbi:MAG: carbohydrate ABC transporter permease [Thermobacillus sp.]|jgi:putative aldouronate transport system permease protein|uniref:Carbohydrate ABC transporter membrane protein 2, CUT1 family, YtcP3 n=1 Tax=Thermobacillus xylanilyticus TaxID=76633 RepID=A0ABM8V7L3_THEXY|nr:MULTISPECIES: carbohydrate ABC transporter permease [Thermobacillus]REK52383.1 MAG: carbohydrate ABC transporter permease [Thermobacillus sp.]CAG5091588.1 Carbohydrate ABC transporter membrane protein 2, CUT1 family, YtcP3 [Thermobacillus xylanilyticus]